MDATRNLGVALTAPESSPLRYTLWHLVRYMLRLDVGARKVTLYCGNFAIKSRAIFSCTSLKMPA